MHAWMCGCMDEICFIKKDELLMYAWLGMMYELPYVWIFFSIFLKNIRIVPHFIVIFNSWNYSTLIFSFTFLNHFLGLINLLTNIFLIISLKHYLNDMHEIAKGLKRFGWGNED